MEKIDGVELDFKNIDDPTYMECLFAVEEDPNNIQYVPQKFQDYELCLIVAKNNPLLLKYITNFTDERVENLMPRENTIVVIDDFITNVPEKPPTVYYEDILDNNKIHYIENSISAQAEIHKYIKETYGDKCLQAAIKQKINRGELELENGILYEFCNNGTYKVYRKTTTYNDVSGWFFTSKIPVSSTTELIRIYKLDYK